MSSEKGDPYQTLGVSREATSSEIKKAYRKLACAAPSLEMQPSLGSWKRIAVASRYLP